MKFARRAEGIKSARTVFKRAREDQRCRHHVYVAAALMEYYCTKDKNIAFRIFELGLKKFADNPEYILCYIDYLSHLNGMNIGLIHAKQKKKKRKKVMGWFNFYSIVLSCTHFCYNFQRTTIQEYYSSVSCRRVASNTRNLCKLSVFSQPRKIVESGLYSTDVKFRYFSDIWNRFLEFESNIGDLASIVKVEKRRSAVLEKIKEFEGKETAQLVDRYKFLDLYPCTGVELRSIGYVEVSSVVRNPTGNSPRAPDNVEARAALPRPDLSQMIPYKPKVNALPGEHPVPGSCLGSPFTYN